MINYANNFAVSASDNKNEFILFFRQTSPVVETDGTVSRVEMEEVSRIVLNKDGLKAFRQLIDGVVID